MASQYVYPTKMFLIQNGRSRAREIAAGVAEMLGVNLVFEKGSRRKYTNNEIIMGSFDGTLTRMMHPHYPKGNPNRNPDYLPGLKHEKPYWHYEEPLPEARTLWSHGVEYAVSPHRAKPAQGKRNAAPRNTDEERRLLPRTLTRQQYRCTGCYNKDTRPTLGIWVADLIVPARPADESVEPGKPVLGNVQALCYPCSLHKSNKSQSELWQYNIRERILRFEDLEPAQQLHIGVQMLKDEPQ